MKISSLSVLAIAAATAALLPTANAAVELPSLQSDGITFEDKDTHEYPVELVFLIKNDFEFTDEHIAEIETALILGANAAHPSGNFRMSRAEIKKVAKTKVKANGEEFLEGEEVLEGEGGSLRYKYRSWTFRLYMAGLGKFGCRFCENSDRYDLRALAVNNDETGAAGMDDNSIAVDADALEKRKRKKKNDGGNAHKKWENNFCNTVAMYEGFDMIHGCNIRVDYEHEIIPGPALVSGGNVEE